MTTHRAKKNQNFAAVPLRALSDLRLGRLHLCVLGIIAAFDRLGKSGSGCWASQNKIAELAGVDKARMSHCLSELRNYGYINSEMNPERRWFRVHRVIYTEEDAQFWEKGKSVAPGDNRSKKSVAAHDNRFGKSVVKCVPISCGNDPNQLLSTSGKTSEISGLQNTDYNHNNSIENKKISGEVLSGSDCAEARNRSEKPDDAKQYLEACENLAASSQRDDLKFERVRLGRLAGDPCLPNELNERAARLLSQIGDNGSEAA